MTLVMKNRATTHLCKLHKLCDVFRKNFTGFLFCNRALLWSRKGQNMKKPEFFIKNFCPSLLRNRFFFQFLKNGKSVYHHNYPFFFLCLHKNLPSSLIFHLFMISISISLYFIQFWSHAPNFT